MSAANGNRCAPNLHGGLYEAATFMVLEAISDLSGLSSHVGPVAMGRRFACCEDHVAEAVAHVMAGGARQAIVRREGTKVER